jgi:putative endonuclease
MYTVYVLYSPTYNKIYIGYTSDLPNRMLSHNQLSSKGYTVRYRPWSVLFTEEYTDKSEALSREKALKSGQGRVYIWEIIRKRIEEGLISA